MRAPRWSVSLLLLAALFTAGLSSCGGDSTGPRHVGRVTVTPAADTLAVGASVTLSATLLDANGQPVSGTTIFWNTENAAFATVSSNGTVTAIAPGVARIAATANGVSGISTITVVEQPVASVRVTPTTAVVTIGGTVHLQAEPLDANGSVLTGRTVSWSSNDPNVVTVDNTGLVTGKGMGATTVTATSEGKTGSAAIAVGAPTPVAISVAPTSVSVTVAQTSQLTATVLDSNAAVISGALVSWTIDNPNIASVSSNGLVTGLAPGGATITAASGSVQVSIPVAVSPVPANAVIVSPSSVSLLVSQRQQFSATVTDANGNPLSGRTVSWSSSIPSVAAVSATGLLMANAPGTTTITATSGGVSGTASVTVRLVPVTQVIVTPDAASLVIGEQKQLTYTLQDSAGNTLSPAGRPVVWSSTNNAVASVDGSGLVTANGAGAAVIRANVENQTGTATFTVTQVPVASVVVTPPLDTILVGASVQLTATPEDGAGRPLTGRPVSWLSSNESVAIVSSTGSVLGRAAGSATITATIEGKVGASTVVVILPPVASVVVSPKNAAIVVGATRTFAAVVKDGSGNTLTGRPVAWSSTNGAVATINPTTGVATGVAVGMTMIIGTVEGKADTATLTVNPVPVATVTVSPPTATITAGTTTTFTAVTKDGSGNTLTGRAVAWSSSNTAVATIDPATGVATGVSAGTVTITATSETKTGTATLTVNPVPVATVTVSPPSATIEIGATTQFTAVTQDGSGNTLTGRTVTWASSDATIATIDPSTGVATGVAAGTVTITATSGGKQGTATLTVNPAAVGSITVDPPSSAITTGGTATFIATVRNKSDKKGSGSVVTWTSSDPSIATVTSVDDSTGVATGVTAGTVTITATSNKDRGAATLVVAQ